MDYPVFIDDFGKKHKIIAFAVGFPKINWEWYATEIVDKKEGIYYGYVMGFEDEWGTFSKSELNENGINLITTPDDLQEIMPLIGWTKPI